MIVGKSQESLDFDPIFSVRNFVRTLSYREFITSLSLVLLFFAVRKILSYYSNEDWVGNYGAPIQYVLMCILVPLNHAFYKIDHKRPNNFIGRNLHDYILVLVFIVVYKADLFYRLGSLDFASNGIGIGIGIFIASIVMIMMFELAITTVKHIIKYFGWQVL